MNFKKGRKGVKRARRKKERVGWGEEEMKEEKDEVRKKQRNECVTCKKKTMSISLKKKLTPIICCNRIVSLHLLSSTCIPPTSSQSLHFWFFFLKSTTISCNRVKWDARIKIHWFITRTFKRFTVFLHLQSCILLISSFVITDFTVKRIQTCMIFITVRLTASKTGLYLSFKVFPLSLSYMWVSSVPGNPWIYPTSHMARFDIKSF